MKLICAIAFWVSCSAAFAQGTLQNLDFEDANLSGYSPNLHVPVAYAFPGWQIFYASTSVSSVGFDTVTIDSPEAAIVDNNPQYGYTPLGGKLQSVFD